ncbi:hypothetical protein OKA05_19950 [Luteolibacter arcticus]|uniref:Beta-barrel porin 2 n=1 Tax=Luteolibacter arcticus TaxID=1581411 RepID=A0ABT3GMV1_9BACT|nr:hypothetical protein [Luteolibacter arcticus]MCW1924848.1 hypothetical protein [Luteolibacter arcticus]
MKRSFLSTLAVASTIGAVQADLYYIPDEAQESLPLKWQAGVNFIWDDNVNPTAPALADVNGDGVLDPNPGFEDEAFSVNPFVGLSFVSITPQTTWDVYARLGAIYYFDEPAATGSDDIYTQSRAGVNVTHRVSERLRFSSRNFISYELEPDYAYGFSTTRQLGEYFYWSTDNSVGYRWTERLATYTGFSLTGLDYDDEVSNQDRFTWMLYNQFRYQLTPQTVLTLDYRYSQTDGDQLASDYTDHHLLLGVEHRFSPNTILIARAGAQFHETDGIGSENTVSPYLEATARSQVNEQFSIRSFVRYGIEGYDTVRFIGPGTYEFSDRQTLRFGVSGEYTVSQMLSVFGGVDYIPATFDDGRLVAAAGPAPVSAGGLDEDVWNAYVGLSVKFTEMLYGTLSYNYTDSESDFANQSYSRNRVSVGVRAEF